MILGRKSTLTSYMLWTILGIPTTRNNLDVSSHLCFLFLAKSLLWDHVLVFRDVICFLPNVKLPFCGCPFYWPQQEAARRWRWPLGQEEVSSVHETYVGFMNLCRFQCGQQDVEGKLPPTTRRAPTYIGFRQNWMAEWVERPSLISVGRGILTHGFEPCSSQTNDLTIYNQHFLDRCLALVG